MLPQPPLHKKISVVIPCYNEAENIKELHGRLTEVLRTLTVWYEIIFAVNTSTDGTEELLRGIARADEHVSVIFFSRNFGNSQYGYSAGTEQAIGDAVIWMEGDLQDPPEVIPKLVERWLEGYDVVYGVRPRPAGSWFMRESRKLFYRLFHKLSYLDMPKDAGDFSLLDRKVVDVLNSMPERSRFVRGLRAWAGFRHIGVEYKRSERKGGVTSNPSFTKNLWWAKKFIFSFSYAPLELISKFALWYFIFTLCVTSGIVIALFAGLLGWLTGIVILGIAWTFMIQIGALAVLGEAISIIFEEVKGRPKYIIREILNNHRVS